MTATVEIPHSTGTAPEPTTRITGVDLARALAMAGMVIVHYVWRDDSGSAADLLAASMYGRAMPLFMVLGGVGVTLAISRAPSPDRALLQRAGILFVMGLIVHELSEWVAVVLASYGLFFAIAPVFRRLPNGPLLAMVGAFAAIGAWSYQVMGGFPRRSTAFADFASPLDLVRSLLVDGYYPVAPVGAFFLLGIWIGRLDLRSDRVAMRLTVAGIVVGVGALLLASLLNGWLDVDTARFELARQSENPSGFDTSRLFWARLLDTRGHSQMPAWLISAAGTAVATIGISLLVAPRVPRLVAPLISLGQLALTFYVFQVVLTKVVAAPNTTSFSRELVTVTAIYVGFMGFAHLWKMVFRSGPLEALLRLKWPGRRDR